VLCFKQLRRTQPAQVELRICIYQLSEEEPAEGEEGAEGDGVPCCAPQCLLCCKACARQLHVWVVESVCNK